MQIHSQYLEQVSSGTLPPGDAPESSIRIWRSRWYDLFSVDDRVEAMREVWGIASYLSRVPQTYDETMQTT